MTTRFGQVIELKPGAEERYLDLHRAVWPEVLATITACNIRNYSIFACDGRLFAYFEYVGDDFDRDMERMAADPVTQKWWAQCEPCQQPIATAAPGEWWAPMPEVFHHP